MSYLKHLLEQDTELQTLLAGMSEADKKDLMQEMSGLFQEVDAMFEQFENRTIYQQLTPEILQQTSDKDLVLTVFDTIASNAPEHLSEAEYLAQLSPERRAVYALYILAGEVDNGGFNQYYYNTEAAAIAYLPAACELVGARAYADLLQQVCACYRENEIAKRHQDIELKDFCASYENNPLNAFDQVFYQLENQESLNDILVKFIRQNIAAFCA